ncbi:phosphotransferase [Jannaschia rubra]|uniref:Putative phosphotransferase related to Ser/Thr protein kinases n=1 Tax=Jannaschia rubra TaxID=282197 RepID=A0A0M6XPC3_9RHOB|nr:phosphotransferase [Jannaschia rubra]CTQ31884.1 putative phosphotransferase related to Ser/Thr protein kinases [Jannaschia rubra]SFG78018.1 Phosphotransferase enzyme family protein [Jannaschia rubra]
MLSQADAAIVARDTALPGLGLVLDAEALCARLHLGPMRPLYLRYKPGTSCVVTLGPVDGGLGAVAVMAHTPARHAEVRDRPEWQGKDAPVIVDGEACLTVVPLRRDRKLKGARRIADAARGAAFLKRLTGFAPGGGVRLLRYKAGRRLVIRVDGNGRAALIKAYAPREFAAALDGARIAEAHGGPAILGVSKRRHCIAWPWLPGDPLSGGAAQGRAAGIALARLHRTSVRPRATVRRAEETEELRAVPETLSALSPGLGGLAAGPVAAASARLLRTDFAPTPIHGDFSADQVLVHEGRATIIDWDRAATGDPARDIGSFLAHQDVLALDGGSIDGTAVGFLDGYAEAGGRVARDVIAVQHARALLALTAEGFRERRPDWPDRTRRLIARAEEVLRPLDPGLPDLTDALDPAVMRPLLEHALGQGVEVVGVDLLRHKPGRRALVRYDMDLDDGTKVPLLGKLRAKGPDLRTPKVHDALRAAGLDGQGSGGVGVPKVRGMVARPALWLQEEVPGRVLTDLLRPGSETGPARRTGEALARLHGAGTRAPRDWSMDDELGVLDRALAAAGKALPGQAARIDAIAVGARRLTEGLGQGAVTGIHRDFYPDQVLVDDRHVWLLDLDLFAKGDPTIDVANLLAHLDEAGLRHHGDAMALAEHRQAFLAGYEDLRPGLDPARVAVLRLVALGRHINLSLGLPGRRHTTDALIEKIEADLALPEVGVTVG